MTLDEMIAAITPAGLRAEANNREAEGNPYLPQRLRDIADLIDALLAERDLLMEQKEGLAGQGDALIDTVYDQRAILRSLKDTATGEPGRVDSNGGWPKSDAPDPYHATTAPPLPADAGDTTEE